MSPASAASSAGSGWTEGRVERLKALLAQGLSASQIALALGATTRNAVLGKIHRLGRPQAALSARSSPNHTA